MDSSTEPEPSEAMLSYFREHPIAYAGFRIVHVHALVEEDALSEREEVPFISTVLFPFLILGYAALKRLVASATRAIYGGNDVALPADGHLFTMTSTHEYRTVAFEDVAERMRGSGGETLLLCSPQAEQLRDRFQERGLPTTTFRERLGDVPISRFPGLLLEAGHVSIGLLRTTEYDTGSLPRTLMFNFVLLEAIKRESLGVVTRDDPAIHTYSPTPYLLESTDPSRVFVYQHGVQWVRPGSRDFTTSCPPFVALTYLVWSDVWRSTFERYVHPDSRIVAVGNPWYDRLAERARREEVTPEWDVLFVSAAHTTETPEHERRYESLARTVFETCEARGLSLAVKLHPNETGQWYRERGWGEHVVEFDGISDALLASRVAITNTSSTFVESAVLGRPILVADVYDKQLDALAPIENVLFPEDLKEIPRLLEGVLESDPTIAEELREGRNLVDLGGSTERIVEYVSTVIEE